MGPTHFFLRVSCFGEKNQYLISTSVSEEKVKLQLFLQQVKNVVYEVWPDDHETGVLRIQFSKYLSSTYRMKAIEPRKKEATEMNQPYSLT